MQRTAAVLVLALAAAGAAADAAGARKPRLDLRATPRMALPPVEIFAVAELVGGDELEEYYCPGLEWDWDDGDRSGHDADCAPFEPGMELDRLFTAHHVYRSPGEYNIRLTMRRVSRSLTVATARVVVHGAGY